MKAPDIARLAAELVGGDRAEQYGPMSENFGRIAAYWRCYMACRPDPEAPISAEDVGPMMMLLKLARTQSGPHGDDSWVDMAGYAACGGEVASTRSSR